MQRAVELQFDPETLALFRYVLQGLSFRNRSESKIQEHTVFNPLFYERVLALYCEDNTRLAKEYIDINRVRTKDPVESAIINQKNDDNFERKCE
jgi:hypothetical protein